MGTKYMQYALDRFLRSLITQVTTGAFGNPTDNRAHACCHIPMHRLGRLQVYIEDRVIRFRVELRHQGQQAAGLAGLTRGMEHEIPFLPDQTPDFFHIPTR